MIESGGWAYDRFERAAADWTEGDKEAEQLNAEAFLALGQARADIITPIVQLLRSDVPLDAIVRAALADAFEGKARFGIPLSFKVVGQDMGPLGGKAQKEGRFKRDLAIGRLIWEERQAGASREQALQLAADRFRIGEDSCRRAMGVYAKFETWRGATAPAIRSDMELPGDLRERLIESIYFERVVWQPVRDS